MTAEEIIIDCFENQKRLPFAVIWKSYTGGKYYSLTAEQKTAWKKAVRKTAERGSPLPPAKQIKP